MFIRISMCLRFTFFKAGPPFREATYDVEMHNVLFFVCWPRAYDHRMIEHAFINGSFSKDTPNRVFRRLMERREEQNPPLNHILARDRARHRLEG